MTEIIPIPELTEDLISQIKWIFFASSSLKEFSSPERKEAFFKRWCGDYLTYYPQEFFIMIEGSKILGYLSGCSDSVGARKILEVPAFDLFSDQFNQYPAHFHINFHPDIRGKGLGSMLVESYCLSLKDKKTISGVHLITSDGAPNISFYRRLGFKQEIQRELGLMKLLFMGKTFE
jgi:ribosomal protein S18 acetylase RimI-like enzyme